MVRTMSSAPMQVRKQLTKSINENSIMNRDSGDQHMFILLLFIFNQPTAKLATFLVLDSTDVCR